MPSITREQAAKLNAQAPAPWQFDVRYYVIHGEKTLVRHIDLDGGKFLEARLYFSENCTFRPEYGATMPNGTYHITLHHSVWSPSSTPGVYRSGGMGRFTDLDGARHSRKVYKDLCKLAATIDDNRILTLAGVENTCSDLELLQLPS